MITLTLNQNSKNSLRAWVNRIKRYEAELPMLYQKLEYLEVKSIGYNSPSFEPRLSSNGSGSFKGIDYWLEKIDVCERKIKHYEDEIRKYHDFVGSLDDLERIIFHQYFYLKHSVKDIIQNNNIKRYQIYDSIKKINKLYFHDLFKISSDDQSKPNKIFNK